MKPILFSTPMVKAILEGKKTQTRRVINFDRVARRDHATHEYYDFYGFDIFDDTAKTMFRIPWDENSIKKLIVPPYQIGYFLQVRETHYREGYWVRKDKKAWTFKALSTECKYFDNPPEKVLSVKNKEQQTETGWYKRPSIFMPHVMSRITLEITGIEEQRLQDITVEDCIAEGLSTQLREHDVCVSLRTEYKSLWDKLNSKRGYFWSFNPWVWAITFKVARIK
jgi:hypothetical protein